jgi:hypothetical protein
LPMRGIRLSGMQIVRAIGIAVNLAVPSGS